MNKRVFDCFIYLNEADIARLRILSLADVVDTFIVLEGETTFSGLPHEPRFRQDVEQTLPGHIREKIDYAIMGGLSSASHPHWPWFRAAEQEIRDELFSVVADFEPHPLDLVMISDCDEIPRLETIQALTVEPEDLDLIYVLGQRLHYYWLDLVWDVDDTFQSAYGVPRAPWWWGTRVASWHRAQQEGAFNLRVWKGEAWLPDAGWHYSFVGNRQQMAEKLTGWSHAEMATEENLSLSHYELTRNAGLDWVTSRNQPMRWLSPAAALDAPGPVQENLHQWLHLFHPKHRGYLSSHWARRSGVTSTEVEGST